MEELLKELQKDLETELVSEIHTDSDRALLSSKIKGAYMAVRRKRNYQVHHAQAFIDSDMYTMYDIIRELAMYDYNQIGAEGQSSDSDNGHSRTWIPRSGILIQVIPFVTVFQKGK